MSGGYCVLAQDTFDVSVPAASRALAKATGRVAADIARELHDAGGIVARGLTQSQADQVAGALSNSGTPAFVLPENALVRFPPPVFLETARLGDGALEVEDLRNEKNQRLGDLRAPYADIVFVASAHVGRQIEQRVVQGPEPRSVGIAMFSPMIGLARAARGACGGGRGVRRVTKTEYDHFLDLFAVEPAHHLRLNAGTFNFPLTGMELQPSSVANLTQFIRHLAPLCGSALVDPSVRHILDGNPLTNLRFDSPGKYEAYLSWRIQLLYHPQTG